MRIGTDIVKISRLKDKESLAKKILSKKEFEIYLSRANKEEFLAGRFAAKEAFMKAVGKGLSTAPLNEIEVRYDDNGAPFIFFKDKEYACSLSHDGEYAIATVLYE